MSSLLFNFEDQYQKVRQLFSKHLGDISISLPFVSITVDPQDIEGEVAKEITIRLADRRVLNAKECCDNCIDNALQSLQEIRAILVDKQVQLSSHTDNILYLLIEYKLEAIRQFLTYEQKLHANPASEKRRHPDLWRSKEVRKEYFDSLEILRSHLHKCLIQVSSIAGIEIPKIAENMRYDSEWDLSSYKQPKSLSN